MKEIFEKIWKLALPYLRKGRRKDYVLHSQGVVRAMQLLLEAKKADEDILIPAAILHDVGWSKVPVNIQKNWQKKENQIKGAELHLKHAPPIIREILKKVSYNPEKIEKIIDIVMAHKFQDPEELDKQLLIDADALSDAFKEQFESDLKSYQTTPENLYQFRKKNKFYNPEAKKIFEKELNQRIQ